MFKIYDVTDFGKSMTFTLIGEMTRRKGAALVNAMRIKSKADPKNFGNRRVLGYDCMGNLAIGG